MPNTYFQFKQFTVHQELATMKVCTDACLFGAWVAKYANIPRSANTRGLDIGTGTGLLSLMLVQQTSIGMDAIDIDGNAIAQCTKNVEESPWPNRIGVIAGDVLTFTPESQYDLVVSNPPFFADDLKSPETKKNLAKHEGGLSLDKLFSYAKSVIRKQGEFAVLLPARRTGEALRLAHKYKWTILRRTLVTQTNTHRPFRVMLLLGESESQIQPETIEETISIRGDHGYTKAFADLLQPYYLGS